MAVQCRLGEGVRAASFARTENVDCIPGLGEAAGGGVSGEQNTNHMHKTTYFPHFMWTFEMWLLENSN